MNPRALAALMQHPRPIFLRFFLALVALTILASTLFGVMFGSYQERVTADTLAPVWAAAIKQAPTGSEVAEGTIVPMQVPVALHRGPPPANAYSVADDPRSRALVTALAQTGVSVTDVRLDDDSELPVTWLLVQPAQGAAQWLGFEGGLQPGLFRTRTWRMLAGLLLLMAVAAWFISRWVARPLERLSLQLEPIARGELPMETVRGPREIERFAQALAGMARQRAGFEEQRRTMLLGVSHDLRSPLTRIRVAADLLEHEPALRDLIVRNIEHADAIIEGFLAYVRTDAEAVDQAVDLAQVGMTAARLVDLAKEQIRVAPQTMVRGNPTLLQRLVINLLENALKHGAPPVTLDIERVGTQVQLRVTDRGPGIADPQRMLRPFERGDTSRGSSGAGLGLAIVARIVQRHQGELEIGAADVGGTRITVRLPALG